MNYNMLLKLKEAGVETDRTLQRFMGNESLYEKFLIKFNEDENFYLIKPAIETEDYEAAFAASHTLKGVSANLGMTRLYQACSEMVMLLREEKYETAARFYRELQEAYEEIYRIIKGYGRLIL